MTRLALSALLATLALLGAASPASAHTDLRSSDPANGASPAQRPTRLTLTFTEPVPAESATVTVTAPDGSTWPTGQVTADGATLTVPLLDSASPAGLHTVSWKVESLDGDFVDGTFAFTVPAPPPAPQPPAATTPAAPPAVTSADAAPTSSSTGGSVATITAVSTGTSTPAAASGSDDDGGGVPLWVWILVVAVLAVVGIAVGVGLNRRAKNTAAGNPGE
ncbi:copper resistance protein CopC [Saccharothrix sp. S26]|uniref:copper resistance CopC family protein n=1 Tax=Saccharothrix sp. S26 TaxID=2907215 RepID=UPI001F331F7C|nr:copper resistance CopC family protein [Saccharothrix sp. S26]MCE6996695.1 copper resistance protein CopC [Saccharothrix sp. S26]